MTHYQPDTPRAALALGALFLSGITLAALVAGPAVFDARTDAPLLLAAARGSAPAPIEVAIAPARIDVVGRRESVTAQASPIDLASVHAGNLVGSSGAGLADAPQRNVAWAMPDASAPCRPQG